MSKVHNSIIETYQEDFSKHAGSKNLHRMRNVFNFVAGNVGKRIKYSNISSQDQSGTLKKDLNLLSMARIIGNYSLISLPLYLIERLEVLVEYYLLKDRR